MWIACITLLRLCSKSLWHSRYHFFRKSFLFKDVADARSFTFSRSCDTQLVNAFHSWVLFEFAICFQHLMSGWLWDYSYKCQPIDYSVNKKAMRVSWSKIFVKINYLITWRELLVHTFLNPDDVSFAEIEVWNERLQKFLFELINYHKSTDKVLQILFSQMANLCWWYYISKLTEFADTIFFVMRKKDSQVTFLHLYHHSLTPLETWILVKFLAGKPLLRRESVYFSQLIC